MMYSAHLVLSYTGGQFVSIKLSLISPHTIFYRQWAEICVGQANMKGNTYPLKQFVKNLFSCLRAHIQILFHKGMYCNFLALLLFRKLSFLRSPVPCFDYCVLADFALVIYAIWPFYAHNRASCMAFHTSYCYGTTIFIAIHISSFAVYLQFCTAAKRARF